MLIVSIFQVRSPHEGHFHLVSYNAYTIKKSVNFFQ